MEKHKDKFYFTMIAIVAIVAIVGITTLFSGVENPTALNDGDELNLAGEAYRSEEGGRPATTTTVLVTTTTMAPSSGGGSGGDAVDPVDTFQDFICKEFDDNGSDPFNSGHVSMYNHGTYSYSYSYHFDECFWDKTDIPVEEPGPIETNNETNDSIIIVPGGPIGPVSVRDSFWKSNFDGNMLREAVCIDNQTFDYVEYECEFGCYRGKCMKSKVIEPEVHSYINVYRYQEFDGMHEDQLDFRISSSLYGYDAEADYEINLGCDLNDNWISSSSESYPENPDYSDLEGRGWAGLFVDGFSEADFAEMNCWSSVDYGPLWYYNELLYGGLTVPKIQQLIIMKEMGSDQYYINFVGNNPGGIEEAFLEVGFVFETDTKYEPEPIDYRESEYELFSFDYEKSTTSVNEMIPIKISDGVDWITLWLTLEKDSDTYRTSANAWKEYVLVKDDESMSLGKKSSLPVVTIADKQYEVIVGETKTTDKEEIKNKLRDMEKKEFRTKA